MKAPSEKQIKLADLIADSLKIDFPQSSKDFTAFGYWNFINKNIDEFYTLTSTIDEDDLYDQCENDIWGEYY